MGKICFQARTLEHLKTIFYPIYGMRKIENGSPGRAITRLKEISIYFQSAVIKFTLFSLLPKQRNMNLSSGVLGCPVY